MGLLTANDLPTTLTPDQLAARAEALVASAMCPGLPDLALREWQVEHRPRNVPRAYGMPLYGSRVLGPSVLKRWPVTGVSLLTQNGISRLSDASWDNFSVTLDSLTSEFLPLSVIAVVFTTGWATSAEVPEPIRQAVALTVQHLNAMADVPSGLTGMRLPELSLQFKSGADPFKVPPAALELLAPWRMPW